MRKQLRRRQAGFTLVELMLAAILASAALAGGMWSLRQATLKDVYRAQGDTMKAVGNAAGNEYILRYYGELQKATPAIAGVANPYKPTMAELRGLGLPIQQFSDTGFNGLPFLFDFARTPVGCAPPACDVTGQVYLGGPLTDPSTGKVSAMGLGNAIATIGGDGGFSDDVAPATISGFNGQWSKANPMGSVVGILAMQLGYGTLGYQQFLRRDGSLPMLGTLNMQDGAGLKHDIASVKTIDAQKALLPAGNSLQIGSGYFYGDTSNIALRSQPGGGTYIQDVNGNPADIGARSVNASVNVNATNNITAGQEIYAGSWLRTLGDGVVYFQKYGGGLYMSDSTWIRAYAGRSIWTPQTLQADVQVNTGSLYSWGRARTGEFLQIDGVAGEGWGCWPSGLVAQDGNGRLLACQSGVWQAPGSVPSGTMCGNSQDGRYDWTGPGLCQGNDPWYSCPSGFHQHVIASIKGETAMTCQKD